MSPLMYLFVILTLSYQYIFHFNASSSKWIVNVVEKHRDKYSFSKLSVLFFCFCPIYCVFPVAISPISVAVHLNNGLSGGGNFLVMVLVTPPPNEGKRGSGARVLLLLCSKNKIKCLKGQREAHQRHATYCSRTSWSTWPFEGTVKSKKWYLK